MERRSHGVKNVVEVKYVNIKKEGVIVKNVEVLRYVNITILSILVNNVKVVEDVSMIKKGKDAKNAIL